MWRPVVDHETSYEVSNRGRVRSLDRVEKYQCNGVVSTRRRRGRHLMPWRNRNGYMIVSLGSKARYRYVHRLVLAAFVGPAPSGMQTRHLNGNPADNQRDNLAWGTSSENQYDQVHHGTHHMTAKERCVRGHELSGKNLRPNGSTRICWACQLAGARRDKPADVAALADRIYAQLLSGWRPVQPSDRNRCPLEHLLAEPNLTQYSVLRGARNCLACNRASSRVNRARHRGITLDRTIEADRYYKRIMDELVV